MSEPPTFPELPEYLVQDLAMLDLALRRACRDHLARGVALPAEVVTLLCERFVAYSKAMAEVAAKPRGNPGKNTGRVVAALVGTGWRPRAAVAHVATKTEQDPETVEKNYRRWLKRSHIDE